MNIGKPTFLLSFLGLLPINVYAGDLSLVQKTLQIPPSIATVIDANGNKPKVILIQDIHLHPEAQDNIRATVLLGLRNWGVDKVFLEGAWAPGRNRDFPYSGLEEETLYRENVAAYQSLAEIREEALRELETARLFGRIVDADSSPSLEALKHLIELRLKPSEYAEYAKNPFHPTIDTTLARAVKFAEHFYELVNQRSNVFLAKTTPVADSGAEIVVVGGFHTPDMASALRAKGISFVVLTPRVTRGGYEKLYSDGMHETVNALKLH